MSSISTDLTDTLNSMKSVLEQSGYGAKVIFGLNLAGGENSTSSLDVLLILSCGGVRNIFFTRFVVVIGGKSGKLIGHIGAQCIGDGLKSLTSLTSLDLNSE